jgi:hypothetical protein
MIENSYYSQDVHGPYELHDIGNLDFIFPVCASGMMCVRNTSFSRKNST